MLGFLDVLSRRQVAAPEQPPATAPATAPAAGAGGQNAAQRAHDLCVSGAVEVAVGTGFVGIAVAPFMTHVATAAGGRETLARACVRASGVGPKLVGLAIAAPLAVAAYGGCVGVRQGIDEIRRAGAVERQGGPTGVAP